MPSRTSIRFLFTFVVAMNLLGGSLPANVQKTETLPIPPAALFPELTPKIPLGFNLENDKAIHSIKRRQMEWETPLFPTPSWPALLAISLSILILCIFPLPKKEKIVKVTYKIVDSHIPEEIYNQMIDNLRCHLNEHWGITAMESSLQENLYAIEMHPMLNQTQRALLKHSLSQAELIKFNQARSTESECAQLYQQLTQHFPSYFIKFN